MVTLYAHTHNHTNRLKIKCTYIFQQLYALPGSSHTHRPPTKLSSIVGKLFLRRQQEISTTRWGGGGEDGRCSRRECVVVAPNGVVLICELCIFATFSHCWQLDLPQVAHATTELCKVALAEALRNFDFTDSWCRAENNKPNTHRYASNIYMCVCCVWHDSINLDAKVSRLLRQKAQHAQSGRLHKSCERALSWQRQGLCKVVGEC